MLKISCDNLKKGMVIFELDWTHSNDEINLANIDLVLGIDEVVAKSRYETLMTALDSYYVTKDALLEKMNKVTLTAIRLGSFYVNQKSMSFVSPLMYDTIKEVIKSILTLQIPTYHKDKLGMTDNSVYVIQDLCVKESIIDTWALKQKLLDKTVPTYLSIEDYKKTCFDVISVKDNDFNLEEKINAAVKDIVSGNTSSMVQNFVKGQLIVRKTDKRARVLLVLGKEHDYGETFLLEIYNVQKREFVNDYFVKHYLATIQYVFKNKSKEVATQEYYDTGLNVYDLFKEEIERKLHNC